nr:MAG TPA: hypothetical protein [Caudoviricetes sp.]DAY21723.1 MAG TPA: hypothetical protein [Caudoviricetes sp.]
MIAKGRFRLTNSQKSPFVIIFYESLNLKKCLDC